MLKYKDQQFLEFLRRVMDFPRRGLLNPSNPDFSEVLIEPTARQTGTSIELEPELYYFGHLREPKTAATIPVRSYVPYYPPTRTKTIRRDLERETQSKLSFKPENAKLSQLNPGNGNLVQLGPEKNPIDGAIT